MVLLKNVAHPHDSARRKNEQKARSAHVSSVVLRHPGQVTRGHHAASWRVPSLPLRVSLQCYGVADRGFGSEGAECERIRVRSSGRRCGSECSRASGRNEQGWAVGQRSEHLRVGWIVSQEIRKNGKVTNKQQETGERITVQTNTCLVIFCNLCTVKYRSSPSSSCKTWRRGRGCWASIPGSSTRAAHTSSGDARRDPGTTEASRLLQGRLQISPDIRGVLPHQHRNPGRATG